MRYSFLLGLLMLGILMGPPFFGQVPLDSGNTAKRVISKEKAKSKSQEGKQLFEQFCSICHAVSLQNRPPGTMLLDATALTDERIIKVSAMQSEKISKEQIALILDYIREEQQKEELSSSSK